MRSIPKDNASTHTFVMFPDTERTEEGGQEATGGGVVRCPPLPPSAASSSSAAGAAGGVAGSSGLCNSDLGRICITVAPFTGGPFQVRVNRGDTIEELKKLIARRLKVAKERIYLLYRER